MKSSLLWSRILIVVGAVAMLLGTLDPLEGSLLILPGSGLIALGTLLRRAQPSVLRYWVWAFILIGVGVGAMFVLSAFGGIGGRSGHSMWWGIFILPYPVGWFMALAGGIVGLVRFLKARRQAAQL